MAAAPPASLEIDATDLPRELLHATLRIPLAGALADEGGDLVLWYPKWVQGSHAPGGPIQNLAGLEIADGEGNALTWRRTPGEAYQLTVKVSAGTAAVVLRLRYICNQSSANSHGLDSFGSESLGLISTNTVLFYPDGIDFTEWPVACSVRLPAGWKAATALTRVEAPPDAGPDAISYEPVSLETLIDSPIMAGHHVSMYDLVEPGVDAPPHRMHVFSEVQTATRLDPAVVDRFRHLVTQATRLFGSHPFPSFDFLVATTQALPRNGLEHQRSSMNIIPLGRLDKLEHLKGWDRMLIPHEYLHAWCGKFRRPAGMITRNPHTPQDTELLWVYEGLTQHLGEVLEVRSGLTSIDEYRWQLGERFRWGRFQQGRTWRPLLDTASASHLLRQGVPRWGHLRRDQDYYFEGALFWLEVDARLRRASDGTQSLDDFCRDFFGTTTRTPRPLSYSRQDVVDALNRIRADEWDQLVARRIERPRKRGPLEAAAELGYLVQFTATSPEGPDHARIDALDARDSLGASFSEDGTVQTVLLDSPADEAQLAPGMRILGVHDHLWSRDRLLEALEATPVRGEIRLLVVHGDRIERRTVSYEGGPRFMTLTRDDRRPDGLEALLKPRN